MWAILIASDSAAFTMLGWDSLSKLNRATRKLGNDQQTGSFQRTTRRKRDGERYTYRDIKSYGAV